jgi:uncharacterized protein (TIGR03437 family)
MMKTTLLIAFALAAAGCIPAAAQSTATIDIDTTTTTPVRPNFSGFNNDVTIPIEPWDYHFNALAAQLSPGWIRFPGGENGDVYDWQTGLDTASWVAQFNTTSTSGTSTNFPNQSNWLAGKGGEKFVDGANQANLLGAKLLVCANGFTDSAASIGQMAAYAKSNGISVAAWELSNEPYNFPNFFSSGTDYLNKMKPYRDAIKAADPNAIVSVFLIDPRIKDLPSWNTSIAAYPNKYWDAVSFHYYPAQSKGTVFSQWMADENGTLATASDAYITGYLEPLLPNTPVLISEFNPSIGGGGSTTGLTTGTLYAGIYGAEFTMRMTTVPEVVLAGPHAIYTNAGVAANAYQYNPVNTAAAAGTSIDTSTLNFGYYSGAEGLGMAVLNGVLKNAVNSNKTTVTGGATVPATGAPKSVTPALYAVAYTNATGGVSVVVTNKSATSHQVTVRMNGTAPSGPFPVQFITATDPSSANTFTVTSVAIQASSSGNPVTVPPYSVLRADLTSPPVATLVSSADYRTGPAAPSQLVTAFGSGFAASALAAQALPLPTTLGNTTISITDSAGLTQPAPLLYVSPGQANFLVADGTAAGAATVKVMVSGSTVLTGSLTVATVAPGLFTANGNGAGVAAATALRASASGTITPLTFFTCQSAALSCRSSALSLGSSTDTVYVTLYGTGIRGAKSVTAYVAGQAAPVLYAGTQGSFAGLDQVNITIPHSLAGTGEASVYLIADGQMSNVVSMKIQ